MGNMQDAGFGDTRLSSNGDDYETDETSGVYQQQHNINPHEYTYRNGVNYKKIRGDKENL